MLSRRSLYFLQRQCSRMYSNGAISLLAMLVPISVAHIAYADSTTPGSHSNLLCDQLYPCAHCVRRKVACSWPTIEPNRIQHFLGPMRLSFGAAGSARLDAKYDKSGNNVQMEWQGAVEEREDLRLVQHSRYPPSMICPPSAVLDGEQETFDRRSNRLDRATDGELLDRASELLPQTPIPSTLLLNTLLRARPSTNFLTAPSTILNSGNCLAVLNLDNTGSSRKQRKTSAAYWRIGGDSKRPNGVGMGVFEEQHQDDAILRPSRFDKFGTFDDLPPFQVKNRKPICTTMAPILQIQATPLKYSNMFAVRTVNAISFYPTKGIESPVHRDLSTSVHEYQGRELNRRSIADMALGGICGGEIGTGLVVDIEGALFGFGLGRTEPLAHFPRNVAGVKPTMYALRRGKRKDDYSGFAKVVWGGSRGMDAVVGLEDEVLVFDLRSPKSSLSLITSSQLVMRGPLAPQSQPNLITSLTNPQSSIPFRAFSFATETPTPIHTICTTSDIVWLDERMPGKDVMRWGHDRLGRNGRGFDRTLQIMQIPSQPGDSDGIESVSRLVLHSKVHSHLSFYTYSSSGIASVRSLLDPYSLPSPTPTSDKPWTRAGLSITPVESSLRRSTTFRYEGAEPVRRDPGWIILESGVHGDLHSRFVALQDQEETARAGNSRRSWFPIVEQEKMAVEYGAGQYRHEPKRALGMVKQKVEMLDLRLAYRGIFGDDAKAGIVVPTKKIVVDEDEEMSDLEANSSAQILSEVVSRMDTMKALLSGEVDHQNQDGSADVGVLTGFELATFANQALQPDTDSTDIDPLPRPTTFLSPLAPSIHTLPPCLAPSLLESTTQAMEWIAPWSIQPFSETTSQTEKFRAKYMPDSSTNWSTLAEQAEALKDRYGIARTLRDKYGQAKKPAAPHPLGAACEQVVLDIALASHFYSARSIAATPASLDTPNTPFPLDKVPPAIHFSFFRPQISPDFADRPEERIVGATRNTRRRILRPSLESTGARSVLSEWQIGSDPTLYKFTNPYHQEQREEKEEKEKEESQETQRSQRRDKGKRRASEMVDSSQRDPPSSSQFVFGAGSSGFPPSIQARRINPIIEEPPSFSSAYDHTTDRVRNPPSRLGRNTASQPALGQEVAEGSSQSVGESQTQTGMATQVLPGPFGGRIEKKKVKKKRISGF